MTQLREAMTGGQALRAGHGVGEARNYPTAAGGGGVEADTPNFAVDFSGGPS